jgi:hemerythrin-like metal-binding protein
VIDPKYSIGIAEMDAQHARWVALIQQFRAVAEGHMGDATGLSAARQAIDALLDYTRSHFKSEEALLESHRYPGLAAHRQLHGELERAILTLREQLHQQHSSAPVKLNLLVTVWLLEHIHKHDKEYAVFLKAKGLS